jgi:hypothetical protein
MRNVLPDDEDGPDAEVTNLLDYRLRSRGVFHPSMLPAREPSEDAPFRCRDCESSWFRIVPGVDEFGFRTTGTVTVLCEGDIVSWSGLLQCERCGARYDGPPFR